MATTMAVRPAAATAAALIGWRWRPSTAAAVPHKIVAGETG